jgi:acyl-CoA synthetase (AMP-forming)/AMP-acid ligase II
MANYGEVWRGIAEAVPQRTAIITVGEGTLSYGEFNDAALRLAGYLYQNGVRAGDKIAINMHNRPEWLVALFAAFKLGAAPVPINFRYRASEVDALLEDSDAAVLVFPASLAEVASSLETPRQRPIILLQVDDAAAVPLVEGAVPFEQSLTADPLLTREQPGGGELFLYTGGTTGKPKGVVWGVEEMLDIQTYSTYGALGLAAPDTMEGMVALAVDESTPRPVTLPLAPFMHGTALTSTLNSFLLGGTLVIVPSSRFDPAQTLAAMAEHDVTRLIVAGDSVATRLLDAVGAGGITKLPRLKSIMSSGMRFSDHTKEQLHALGDLTITDLLAASECGPFAMAISSSAADLPARMVLTPGTVLFDAERREVRIEPGAVGVLAFGGSLPKGYYKDEVKTAETFALINGHRYVIGGDFARVLDDGSIELLGRGSSVVNTGGEKIFPTEVEEVLLAHPAVIDAVVFGVPHPAWGEMVTAAVVLAAGPTVTESELIEHVGTVLAGYKKPKRILMLESLERSPSGKIDLVALKRDATAGVLK